MRRAISVAALGCLFLLIFPAVSLADDCEEYWSIGDDLYWVNLVESGGEYVDLCYYDYHFGRYQPTGLVPEFGSYAYGLCNMYNSLMNLWQELGDDLGCLD